MKVLNFKEYINEGKMSDLNILAKEASDKNDFIQKALSQNKNLKNDKSTVKYLGDIYDDMLDESLDENLNDPLLVKLRSAKMSRDKRQKEEAERMKKRVYGKKREELEYKLQDVSQELKNKYRERGEVLTDMEEEAGQMGLDDFEKEGKHNEYGTMLDKIDKDIERLIKQRSDIETKLVY